MNVTEQFKANLGRFDVDLGTIHHFSDGLYAKELHIPAGYTAISHSHHYSHLSLLAKGKVIVKTDNTEKEYKAPACLEIEAGIHHSIEALEDCVWYCIHATDETDASKIDEVLIKEV
jgi:quercetin dioxygenase-like cupin family protein